MLVTTKPTPSFFLHTLNYVTHTGLALPSVRLGKACPVQAKDREAVEAHFMMCGLSAERAAALRNEMERNKIARADMSVDEDVAVKFRRTIPFR